MPHRRSNAMLSFLVVGLGMVLIATLAGVVLWAMTKKKAATPLRVIDPEALATSETAEA
jgi:hypothetical protein